jgi:serine/threonine-protein kinase HipA
MADIDLYINKRIAGRVGKTDEKHLFSYHQDADEALSLTMPLRMESYSNPALHPIFQMNLPEGILRQTIERATAKQYGSDDLTMLALLGPNQIGRLAYTLAGQSLADKKDLLPDLKSLLNSKDAKLFEQLLTRFATRSGVAGVQPKVLLEISKESVTNIKTKGSLPLQSYIVKSWGSEYPELGCNEYACLTLARYAGLQLPEYFLSDNGKLLITKRFDLDKDGTSLGFEDFCVLQGKGTKEKYDASLESCANTIRQYVSPIFQPQALYDFFKVTLINILVRNGDAHLKNSGVIYNNLTNYRLGQLPETERKLAPVFDIVSTIPYIQDDTMALSLTGSKRWPKWKVLRKFAKQHCALNTQKTDQAVDEVYSARDRVFPLLNKLSDKHCSFLAVAERMISAMKQPF